MFAPNWNYKLETAGFDTQSDYNNIYLKSDNLLLRKQNRNNGTITYINDSNITKLHNTAFILEESIKKLI